MGSQTHFREMVLLSCSLQRTGYKSDSAVLYVSIIASLCGRVVIQTDWCCICFCRLHVVTI